VLLLSRSRRPPDFLGLRHSTDFTSAYGDLLEAFGFKKGQGDLNAPPLGANPTPTQINPAQCPSWLLLSAVSLVGHQVPRISNPGCLPRSPSHSSTACGTAAAAAAQATGDKGRRKKKSKLTQVSGCFFWRLQKNFHGCFIAFFLFPCLRNAQKRDKKNRAKLAKQPREEKKRVKKTPHFL
jgi:hypothetical protein